MPMLWALHVSINWDLFRILFMVLVKAFEEGDVLFLSRVGCAARLKSPPMIMWGEVKRSSVSKNLVKKEV